MLFFRRLAQGDATGPEPTRGLPRPARDHVIQLSSRIWQGEFTRAVLA